MPPYALPLPVTEYQAKLIGLCLGVALLSALIAWVLNLQSRPKRTLQWGSDLFLKTFATVLAPVWAFLLVDVIYSLFVMTSRFDPNEAGVDLRWHILAFVGLITALGGLVSAPLGLIRVWTTERQTRTAEQGHMTDRISKAIEQLGAEKSVKKDGTETSVPNIEVRVGGLLSLERISQDSVTYDKGRDHVRVMEILCAYIRNNAPARDAQPLPVDALAALEEDASEDDLAAYLKEIETRTETIREWARKLPKPREDIQIALAIIDRRDAEQRLYEARWGKDALPDAEWVFDAPCPTLPDTEEAITDGTLKKFRTTLVEWQNRIENYKGYRPDLRGTNLQSADLSHLNLAGIKFEGAQMQGVVSWQTQLQGASLVGAQLQGTFLWEVQLQGADLWDAQLQGANLKSAQLQGAKIWNAQLQGAKIWNAQLQWADLSGAQMQGANLRSAKLQGADLSGAQMSSATSFSTATLRGAALSEVDCSMIDLTQEQLDSTFGDGSVIWPETLTRPAHWPLGELRWNDFHDELAKWRADPAGYVPPEPPAP